MLKNTILMATILTILVACGSDKSKKETKKESNDTNVQLFQSIPTAQSTATPIPTTAMPTPTATPTPSPTPTTLTGFTRDAQKEVVIDNDQQIMWQDDIGAKERKVCWLTDPDFLDCQAGLPQQHRPSCDKHDSMEHCNLGYTPSPRYTAYQECQNLTLGGYSDWHVPTLSDLRSIVDTSRDKAPFINPIFENTTSLQYWSSTSIERTASLAWVIFFGDRVSSNIKFDKNSEIGIRCVRDMN